jgi:5-methylcytosine-specific restriction endonuclease McrA
VSKHSARGRAWRALAARVLDEECEICHLCGRPGADSVDHLVPVSIDPTLKFARSNLRAAHRKCNQQRGARPIQQRRNSRRW